MKHRVLCMLLACVMLLGLLAGCGSSSSDTETAAEAEETEETAEAEEAEAEETAEAEEEAEEEETAEEEAEEAEETAEATESEAAEETEEAEEAAEENAEPLTEVSLPIATDSPVITLWTRTGFESSDPITSYVDSPIFAYAEELTGVHVEFTEVSSTAETENFNLMIVGGEYADLIYNFEKLYTGGIDSAVEDEVIVNILDYADSCAVYMSYLNSDEAYSRYAVTDEGNLGSFYTLYSTSSVNNSGLTIRGDWLEELGLDAPVTYDDMEEVLLAFKTAYDPEYPLYLPSCGTMAELTEGYGFRYYSSGDTTILFNLDETGENVVFSPACDEMREYLTMMHRWYEEGLISTEFATNGDWMFMNSEFTQMMSTDNVGILSLGAGLYAQFEALNEDENYSLQGIADPKLTEDQLLNTVSESQIGDAILSVTLSENTELAIQWADFWYSEQGSLMANWGLEDISYTIVDGEPQSTELMTNNEEYSERAMNNWYHLSIVGSVKDPWADVATLTGNAAAAVELWNTADDTLNIALSTSMYSLTADESTDYSTKATDILTYCQENVLKFITGDLSIEDDWDSYVAALESMGSEEITEIIQGAYERFLAR